MHAYSYVQCLCVGGMRGDGGGGVGETGWEKEGPKGARAFRSRVRVAAGATESVRVSWPLPRFLPDFAGFQRVAPSPSSLLPKFCRPHGLYTHTHTHAHTTSHRKDKLSHINYNQHIAHLCLYVRTVCVCTACVCTMCV